MKWGELSQAPMALQSLDSRGGNEADHLLDQLLKKAIKLQARRVLLEPKETYILVRCRVSEKLYTMQRFSKHLHSALMERLKERANLDTRLTISQEGIFPVTYAKKTYEILLSTVPGLHGEQVVLSIRNPESIDTTLEELGFWGKSLSQVGEYIAKSRGLLILTGDVACNEKLLLCIRQQLSHASTTIAAIDPTQDPLSTPNIPAATALDLAVKRSPDVITIGSLRGKDMADAALSAAKQHLVIAIITAPSAGTSLALLQHWSSDIYTLAQLLIGVVVQQPISLLPTDAKKVIHPTAQQLKSIASTFPTLQLSVDHYRREHKLPASSTISPYTFAITLSSTKAADVASTSIVQVSPNSTGLQQALITPDILPSSLDTAASLTAPLKLTDDLLVKASVGVVDWMLIK